MKNNLNGFNDGSHPSSGIGGNQSAAELMIEINEIVMSKEMRKDIDKVKNTRKMHTKYSDFLNENVFSKKIYRGVGERINVMYGDGTDEGMGIFWTDNLIMAKWFAGMIDYNPTTERYEKISDKGKVLEKTITFNKPYIIDETHKDYDIDNFYDSFQIYINEIKTHGGVELFKKYLLYENYDGIILEGCTTNYYNDGTYTIYIKL